MPINEANTRRRARRRGYCIRKSRQRKHLPNVDNRGEYMLVDASANMIVLGSRYDATLEDIDKFLTRAEAA
jgi:hypothetical protein